MILLIHKGSEHELKAGEYLFPKGMTPSEMLDQITTGTGLVYHPFTIVAGWNFRHLLRALAQEPNLLHTTASLSNSAIMARIGHPDVNPEGLFFPDTYFFIKGSSDIALLKRAYQLMQVKMDEAWQHRAPDLPYTNVYQAVVAASLIEKETGIDQERAWIAGVIINRLGKNMLLQIDPTVIYDVGKRLDGKIYRADLLRHTAQYLFS